jgi:predicted nucleic acid-binding protein
MTRAFFDTNVVVYAAHRTPDLKHETAQRLLEHHLEEGSLVVSTQVLQETYSVLTRKKMLSGPASLAWVTHLANQEVVPAQASSVLRALALAQRHQLSVWDALMVQAALDSACDVLYTEDLQAGMRFGTLEIVNPFQLSAHEPTPAPPVKASAPPRRRAASAAPAAPAPAARRPRK